MTLKFQTMNPTQQAAYLRQHAGNGMTAVAPELKHPVNTFIKRHPRAIAPLVGIHETVGLRGNLAPWLSTQTAMAIGNLQKVGLSDTGIAVLMGSTAAAFVNVDGSAYFLGANKIATALDGISDPDTAISDVLNARNITLGFHLLAASAGRVYLGADFAHYTQACALTTAALDVGAIQYEAVADLLDNRPGPVSQLGNYADSLVDPGYLRLAEMHALLQRTGFDYEYDADANDVIYTSNMWPQCIDFMEEGAGQEALAAYFGHLTSPYSHLPHHDLHRTLARFVHDYEPIIPLLAALQAHGNPASGYDPDPRTIQDIVDTGLTAEQILALKEQLQPHFGTGTNADALDVILSDHAARFDGDFAAITQAIADEYAAQRTKDPAARAHGSNITAMLQDAAYKAYLEGPDSDW